MKTYNNDEKVEATEAVTLNTKHDISDTLLIVLLLLTFTVMLSAMKVNPYALFFKGVDIINLGFRDLTNIFSNLVMSILDFKGLSQMIPKF